MSTSATRSLTLPPELKLQILLEDVLSRQDLARICLVDKSWLSCAREVLFQTIKVEIRWKDQKCLLNEGQKNEENREDKAQGGLSERALRLLLTLQTDSQLASMVISIEFTSDLYLKSTNDAVSTAIAAFLEACATVESVAFNDKLGNKISECILPNVSLKVDTLAVDYSILISNKQDYFYGSIFQGNLRNLRRLECKFISDHSDLAPSEFSFVNLEVLKMTSDPDIVTAAYIPKLRILQFPLLSLNTLSRIDCFSMVQTLYLSAQGLPPDGGIRMFMDLRILSQLPSLQFLSIAIYQNDEISEGGFKALMQRPPPILSHLAFPSRIPFDILLPLVPSLRSITDLGVSEPLPHEKKKQTNVEELRLSCIENGIRLYLTPKREVDVMKL